MQQPAADQEVVRREVQNILAQSAAYQAMDGEGRRAFAHHLGTVAGFLARDPGWLDAPLPESAKPFAAALGPVDDLKKRLAQKPGQVGQEFRAGAMREGVEAFDSLVKTVDFPKFVSGLIQGVFQAIVDASIQQMEAYGELLAATAKSVGQFAQDHIDDESAREHLASRYPSLLKIEQTEGGGRRLTQKEGAEDVSALQGLVGPKLTVDFNDPDSELQIVTAAKLEMAQQRQKMMALMVMLGINRIIVTNGRINAKVIFDVQASDAAKRRAKASLSDSEESESEGQAFGFTPWAGGAYAKSRAMHKTTVQSAIDDSSDAKAQMKAQLSGEVNVNFRSETLPPEKMLDALQYNQFQALSQPGGAPAAGAASATTATKVAPASPPAAAAKQPPVAPPPAPPAPAGSAR